MNNKQRIVARDYDPNQPLRIPLARILSMNPLSLSNTAPPSPPLIPEARSQTSLANRRKAEPEAAFEDGKRRWRGTDEF